MKAWSWNRVVRTLAGAGALAVLGGCGGAPTPAPVTVQSPSTLVRAAEKVAAADKEIAAAMVAQATAKSAAEIAKREADAKDALAKAAEAQAAPLEKAAGEARALVAKAVGADKTKKEAAAKAAEAAAAAARKVADAAKGEAGVAADASKQSAKIAEDRDKDLARLSADVGTKVPRFRRPTGAPATECDSIGDAAQQLWCYAYHAGLDTLWGTDPNRHARPDGMSVEPVFEEWWRAPRQIGYRYYDRYVLFFDAGGKPIAQLPEIDENDTVVIVAVADTAGKAEAWKHVSELSITNCKTPDPFRIGGSVGGAEVDGSSSSPTLGDDPNANTNGRPLAKPHFRVITASHCSSTSGLHITFKQVAPPSPEVKKADDKKPDDKKADDKKPEPTSASVNIETFSIFHLTLGLGFVYDFSRAKDYRASPVKGEAVPVIVEDDHVEGPAGGLLFLTYRPAGVDTRRSRWPNRFGDLAEWLGISLGLRLTDPLHHIYVGGLVEPYPGFGLTAGAHFHTVNSLASGYKVGDRYPGGEVPIDKRWDISATNAYVGFVLDAAVFAKVLGIFGK